MARRPPAHGRGLRALEQGVVHGYALKRSAGLLAWVDGTAKQYACHWPHVPGACYCCGS